MERCLGTARRTWARPQRVEGVKGDEERLGELERVEEHTVVLPQSETDGHLAGEPRHLEGATGEQVALGLLDVEHRLLDTVGDLGLVQDCGVHPFSSAPSRWESSRPGTHATPRPAGG